MDIDPVVEERVREAYRAVIAKDGDRLVAAFYGLTEGQAALAVAYGLFVCGFVVNDAYPDGPTDADFRDLAAKIIQSESDWIRLGETDALGRLLVAAAKGDTAFTGVPKDDVIGHIFVSGGYLLGVYAEEGQEWWDYLNEIWEELLAAPDPA